LKNGLSIIFITYSALSLMSKNMPPKEKLRTAVIIPAAGKGLRMGAGNKLLMPLMGRPILQRAIDAFVDCPLVTTIVLTVSNETSEFCERFVYGKPGFEKVTRLVPGGATRQASVYNALKSLDNSFDIVLVHDGARPLVERAVIEAAIYGAMDKGAVVPAVMVKDTIKEVSEGIITKTPPRNSLRAVQTPQGFGAVLLRDAFEAALTEGFTGTDEASLVERTGRPVFIVTGSYENIKITTPEDMLIARSILEKRALLPHETKEANTMATEKNKKG